MYIYIYMYACLIYLYIYIHITPIIPYIYVYIYIIGIPYYIIGVTTRLAREMHPQVVTSQRLKILRKANFYYTQMLHVWNIWLHLGHFWGKCR